MMLRPLLLAAALFAVTTPGFAQDGDDAIAAPVLRAKVMVTTDVVRVGDVVDNAGAAARVPI